MVWFFTQDRVFKIAVKKNGPLLAELATHRLNSNIKYRRAAQISVSFRFYLLRNDLSENQSIALFVLFTLFAGQKKQQNPWHKEMVFEVVPEGVR